MKHKEVCFGEVPNCQLTDPNECKHPQDCRVHAQSRVKNILMMAEQPQQKNYLCTFEQMFSVSKPIFIDRNVAAWKDYLREVGKDIDIWCINEDKLVHAKDVKSSNIVGRYKLNLQNSSVQELWFDVESNINPTSPLQVNDHFKELKNATLQVVKTLLDFGIPQDCIYVKSSGKGMHVHCFFENLDEQQFKLLSELLIEKIGLPNSKGNDCATDKFVFGLDLPSTTKTVMKLREWGGINDKLGQNHYCSLVDINKLPKMKAYPFNLNPKDTVYPTLKSVKADDALLQKINSAKTEQLTKDFASKEKVNYNCDGNLEDLKQCPLVSQLIEKSKHGNPSARHNLLNVDRIFLSHLYAFFGDEGHAAIHEILKNCPDYNERETDRQLQSLKKNNHKPVSCEWAKKNVGCPTCTVSCGKTPLNLARKAVGIEQVKAAYLKWYDFTNDRDEEDTDIIDLTIAGVADRFIPGFEKFWLFIVARSGGIKTAVLRGVSKLPHVETLDSLTPKTLVSGIMENGPHGRHTVGGLMQHLDGKALVIKDFTLILTLSSDERNAIFSDLRNAYDGYLDKSFGTTDKKITANAHFGLVAGCTPIIDNYWQLNQLMGDRFLKIRHEIRDRDAVAKAIMEEGRESQAQNEIQKVVNGFFETLDFTREIEVPTWIKDIIFSAVFYTAHMRTPLMYMSHGDGSSYSFAGTMEYATRLAKQAMRLVKLLTIIRGKDAPTMAEVNTMLRVIVDTPPLYRSKLIPQIISNGSITMNRAAQILHCHADTADRVLNELLFIGVLKQESDGAYRFDDKFAAIINDLTAAIAKGKGCGRQEATNYFRMLFSKLPDSSDAAKKDRENTSSVGNANWLLKSAERKA